MPIDRRKLRGVILAEDKRTERFFGELLAALGFEKRNFKFSTAPAGRGAAEAWVALRYPGEVRVLRSKNYQHGLRLIAVRDGDRENVGRRKRQLDEALQAAGLSERNLGEGIATPVPARNIETWLLALLGAEDIDEAEDYKHRSENENRGRERRALRKAAEAWININRASLPSLRDGKSEMERLD